MENAAVQYDAKIRELLDKQEIRDVLTRYCRGVDRVDVDLINSVYHPDATDSHGLPPGGDFGQLFVGVMAQSDRALHFISNETIELDGDVAHCETYVHAVLYHDYTFKGEGEGTTAEHVYARYIDRFERRNSEWKIASRVVLVDSRQTDRITMPRPLQQVSLRSHDDPSYQR
jgi:ketosteroid isomerase-like protein